MSGMSGDTRQPAPPQRGDASAERWHQRARRALRHSLKHRLVALFMLLALLMSGAFLFGMQKALTLGWRDAVRPLLVDYVDRVTQDIGSPPSVERARALAQRLPVTVRISGAQVNWQSHPEDDEERRRHEAWRERAADHGDRDAGLFTRQTADGHRIDYGLALKPWRDRPRFIGWATLGVLLLLTALAYLYVRRLLRPLQDIGAGARRYGQGDFSQPIAVQRPDELGDLAADVNAMASNIHQMLEAKRALLLAISHELRSPITRARLNAELLPESGPEALRRAALLRDLQDMSDLITGLLEGERLGAGHRALQREDTDVAALAREVVEAMDDAPDAAAARIELDLPATLPRVMLDRQRMRLVLRNLLGNALRHSAAAAGGAGEGAGEGPPQDRPVRLTVRSDGSPAMLHISVRDFGPGVDEASLRHLGEAFWRSDAARERATGGVGLGLYLCRLIAQAHGGRFSVRNAQPGLEVVVSVPLAQPAPASAGPGAS